MNPKPTSRMSVAIEDDLVCVRLEGRANFACSYDFLRLIEELNARGYHRFVVDLSDCLNMDSTFLGVMAKLGIQFEESAADKDGGESDSIALLNPNERISDLLDNLDIEHLFHLVEGDIPVSGEMKELNPGKPRPTKKDLTRNCLEAHEVLMKISDSNVAKFKDVARFFAEDLERMES